MKVTIYDVAKKAGVSIATVSKVINHTGNMREETRKKVMNVIEDMNYQPSIMASALSGKGTETLGLLVPDISNPFFSMIARTIEDHAHEHGMSVIMCSTDEDPEREKKYLDVLQRKQVDGFIVASSFHEKKLLRKLVEHDVPLVMLAYDDASLDVSKISVDDLKGGYKAADHLVSLGHRQIAVIAEHTNSSKLRILGFQERLESQGITLKEENIYRTTASTLNGKACFDKIFQRKDHGLPTAIFACNDLLAIGVIQGAMEKRMSIPDDLAIIGFDNTILATTTVPGLTTIAQPIEEMGKKVVEVLIEEIKEDVSVNQRVLFNPELIVRGTT
ncbi:LacI family transcriptional regulator [Lederbergia sp. NSJ-179]|uniref:LacI family DNA-binding transcriptional regulator n=1 Tax=Lederbergia sp. NSJ-179 TaxID=2931402 RepID=UPI001FD03A16|nr:LacI family DNA-binding transcriptional regulator [Lederbergia sp. NSJ-179]MCJ7842286.1 LacI family transcriptional regulator [Lederbergia sp. NSJ-179]